MERLLGQLAEPEAHLTQLLSQLIDEIRPADAHDASAACGRLSALCEILDNRPELRAALRNALSQLAQTHRHSELYTVTGILPNTGFLAEVLRRFGHQLLPEVLDRGLLRTVLRRMFHQPSDHHWVTGVGEDSWLQLLTAMRFDETPASETMPPAVAEILRSLRVLSYWIAACGMEPELLRLEPSLETYESPFVAQNVEMTAYINAAPENWGKPLSGDTDDRQLRVLFGQCETVMARVRKTAARDGTSIRLTYNLQRLCQLLRRSEQLLDILAGLQGDRSGVAAYPPIVKLSMQLICDECLRDNVRRHWRQNTELIALRVTDNASHRGDHYITDTPDEYWSMARSAMIGGSVIAFMACLKLVLIGTNLPPLTGAILFCLNYGLGFCLIHVMHGTVSTKQPAMTANAIAASIEEAGGRLRNVEAMSDLVARTCRSQIVAILGNVCVAIPLAAAIAFAITGISGKPFASPEESLYLLAAQSPVHGGALFYAAIAGVCLFISGLISGYFDNYAAYNRIAERILQLDWPKRLVGESRRRRFATYVGDNLGALAGNFLFGVLLGATTLFGLLLGLPIDIRHVAFSSAFVGIAYVGLDLFTHLGLFVAAVIGVALIGLVNLTVSFVLALNVALRSRRISDPQWRMLARSVVDHLLRQPTDFFLPPMAQKR
ncbi:MAG: site-specific recombinase [Candidatus Accumulibacter sp.]|uniref:site-specific recombinase n=1 Tax=Accumulibacter sp. TaxID=2053492 RepID=UPI0025E46ECE|nr:site-specific recombinase [Accumulibacter sp.]MCP5247739.1 site-specific recombinase [Accumulibacter sp.]